MVKSSGGMRGGQGFECNIGAWMHDYSDSSRRHFSEGEKNSSYQTQKKHKDQKGPKVCGFDIRNITHSWW